MESIFDGKLKFLNHACFYIESKSSILICDPWLEGQAFNNGWSLLDRSSSNKITIEELKKSNKKIFIWYSHEHSDHFSVSFLNELIKSINSFSVIFQLTLDKRIIRFLEYKNINSIQARNGIRVFIDDQLSIYIWSHKNGDSFSLLLYENIKILNLNDCIVSNKKEAINVLKSINKITNEIDLLFTQFGYANWIGNKNDKTSRLNASIEKQERILLQNSFLSPKLIIPFASFIIFSDKDNFYLNLEQNTPGIIMNSYLLKSISKKIIFLKPSDSFNLKNYKKQSKYLKILSNNAVHHWDKLFDKIKPLSNSDQTIDINILINESKNFIFLMNKSFLFMPAILELIGLIKPVCINVRDIDKNFYFSYIRSLKILEAGQWDIKTSSQNLFHSLRYEYGFNTLKVNGKFEVSRMKSYSNFVYFYYFQDLYKEGVTIKKPINLLKKIFQLSIIFFKTTISFRI